MFIDRPKMDPLSQTIALLKPQALAWRVLEAHAPWRIRFPTTDVVVFGQLMEGVCAIELADGSCLSFNVGDFLLMPAPTSWTMGSPGAGVVVDLKAVFDAPEVLQSGVPGAAICRFMAGAFVFAAPNADLLRGLLPPVLHIRGAEMVAGRLGMLLSLLGEEALASRPGRSLVLDRLLEIILVESVRERPSAFMRARPGLLAGLEDPQIGAALKAMHEDVRRPWTVAALARMVGMSRSAFAARFTQAVGAPPMDYLLRWRLNVAKSELVSTRKSVSEIAELVGYQSVSAFSTAFSRATGCSPSAYAPA
jgi:AraC-like DNA-binding protein